MRRIGIVGIGAIGRAVLAAVEDGRLKVKVAGVTSRSEEKARPFLDWPQGPAALARAGRAGSPLRHRRRGSGPASVVPLAEEAFAQGKDLVVISVGALLDRMDLFDLARRSNCRLLVPSGAIAGLDAVKAACLGRIDYVRLTSRKPPAALRGAPFLVENGISLDGLAEERLLFSGPARLAVKGFPDNFNISAALSLAGIGPDRTEVSITCVPGLQRNSHLIEAEGEFGHLEIRLENIPSENPKTGRLTALSIIRALQDAIDVVRVGT